MLQSQLLGPFRQTPDIKNGQDFPIADKHRSRAHGKHENGYLSENDRN
jgi:hypothetical protein